MKNEWESMERIKMIYRYNELKQYIKEDFDMFYSQMKFNEKQIYPAILDEYKHGKDSSGVKHICVYVFIILNYIQNEFDIENIYMELEDLLEHVDEKVLQQELKEEYSIFLCDIDIIKGHRVSK